MLTQHNEHSYSKLPN